MCQDCQPFIKRGSKILDIGCGSGIVAKALSNFFQSSVLGVDIQDKRVVNIPFQIIDGENLPFKENGFNVCFISYVLHHSENPERLLKEAKRVSKERIIIFEDLPENPLSKIFCSIHEITFNPFFHRKNPGANFKKAEGWEEIFAKLSLKIIFKKRIFPLLGWTDPVKRALFVLEKV